VEDELAEAVELQLLGVLPQVLIQELEVQVAIHILLGQLLYLPVIVVTLLEEVQVV
jgi:hypothetical protein